MDRTPDVSDFNYEEEGGDYGENDDNGNDVYDESMLPASSLAFYGSYQMLLSFLRLKNMHTFLCS